MLSNEKYRPDIDGLRAVAILAVIVNHFFRDALPGGFLGVDVFFVISGYVITSSLLSHDKQHLSTFLIGFWSRRVRRLLPALAFCIAVTCLVGFMVINPLSSAHDDSAKTGITALFGMSNLFLFKNSIDYFGSLSEVNLFTQTWSLGVEEQFYFIYPLIFWAALLSYRFHGGAKWIKRVVLGLSVVSLALFLWCLDRYPTASYYLMPMRFWELGAGVLIRLAASGTVMPISNARISLLALGLLASFMVPADYQMASTIAAVSCTTMLIVYGRNDSWIHKILTYKALVYIGLISYSLYLWHWSVLAISRWTIGVHWWSFPLQFLLILLLAVFSYYCIERPLRYSNLMGKGIRAIASGFLMAVVAAGIVWVAAVPLKHSLLLGESPKVFLYEQDWKVKGCNILEDQGSSSLPEKGCGLNVGGKKTIYMLGDSHAEQFMNVISYYANQRSQNVLLAWGNSCSFPRAATYKGNLECDKRQDEVFNALLARVHPGDVVIVGNALYARFSGDWEPDPDFTWLGNKLSIAEARDLYMQSLGRVARALRARGARVVVYLDSVQFYRIFSDGIDPSMCYRAWFAPFQRSACQRDEAGFLSFRAPIEKGLRELEAQGLIQVWDGLDEHICKTGKCYAEYMKDSNHFRADYGWTIGKQLMQSEVFQPVH